MSTTDTPVSGVHADSWSADKYNAVASFVYSNEFTAPVFALLNAQPGERILDLGCGSGELTTQLAKLVGEAGVVLGVDSSTSMVEKARQNGVSACFVGDAQDLHLPPSPSVASEISASLPASFDYTFDAVFTNAALHWCKRDPRSVAVGVARILREKGRFVGEMGGFTNCVGLRMAIHTVLRRRGFDPAALDPWYFPSIEDYKQVLESAGLRITHLSLTPRLTLQAPPYGGPIR
ncbi:S-adenosyl-L-methionine-dependent methyltransferase [Phellopilus nigrolimitatus]|nr:S-adenosyl-L-methionine-dependent methyltransferase [Phellopilus nigrolimitatus]